MHYGANLARSLVAASPATGAAVRRVLQGFAENILARTSVSKEAAPMVAKGMAEEAEAGEALAESIRPKASNAIEQDVYSGVEALGQMVLLPLSCLGGEAPVLAGFGIGAAARPTVRRADNFLRLVGRLCRRIGSDSSRDVPTAGASGPG